MWIMYYTMFVRACAVVMLGAGVVGIFSALFGKTREEAPEELSTLVLLLAPASWSLWGFALLNIGQPWVQVAVPIAIVMGVLSIILKNRAKTA